MKDKRANEIVNKVLQNESPDGTTEALSPDLISFDGNFECANIEQVRRRGTCQYDIFMRNDSNGSGCLQWFMFKMKNLSGWTGIVKISIVNFTKGNSLFLKVSILNLCFRVCNQVFGQK